MNIKNTVLIGADPELFMRDPDNGSFVSAHGRIPGTKAKPYKVLNGAVQVDGTALEFNIDPASTIDEFVRNITSVRKTLTEMVPGYNVVAEPVARYDAGYFRWEVPSYAQELGCMPDFNAWTMDINPRPNPGGEPFRTAAGHIHIGWSNDLDIEDKETFIYACRIARQLDHYIGVYSVLWDRDSIRRKLYGRAGAFRPKPYGIEYRVLSNKWLDSEPLMRWIYNSVQCAMADAFSDNWAEDFYGDLARSIIDNNETNWPESVIYYDLGLEPLPKVA